MHYKLLVFVITIVFLYNCKSLGKNKKDYILYNDEGVFVEKFDSINHFENRYTANNKIYVEGNVLTYDYYYQDLNGKKFKFQMNTNIDNLTIIEKTKAWSFIEINKKTNTTIDKIVLTVEHGLKPFIRFDPSYNESVIKYKLIQNDSLEHISSTGLIENEKNIWLHPPREKFFQILELNPFPFIQAPYEIGNRWEWELEIGSAWGDERWKTWDKLIKNKYNYEITAIKTIATKIGDLKCYEIKSTATSSIGKTYLTAYFNMKIGFVKLEYTNIDTTKTILDIMKFEKK